MENKMIKKLEKYLMGFQIVDLVGFGTILAAERKDDFEDYKQEIFNKFLEKDDKAQKWLLQLARDIYEQNREDAAEILKRKKKKKKEVDVNGN